MTHQTAKDIVGTWWLILHVPCGGIAIITDVVMSSHLAASRSSLISCLALHLVVIAEEVGVALVAEGQAQNSLGVCHSVALIVIHLAVIKSKYNHCSKPRQNITNQAPLHYCHSLPATRVMPLQ